MSPQAEVDRFNGRYPVGTRVKAYRGVFGEDVGAVVGATRTAATVLSGHSAVVWVEGCSGCVALSHIVILGPHAEPPHPAQPRSGVSRDEA